MDREEFAAALADGGSMTVDEFRSEMRSVFPGESDDLLMSRLWGSSAYPFAGGNFDLYLKQIKRSKEVEDSGARPCDGCGEPSEAGEFMCGGCLGLIRGRRPSTPASE